MAVILKSLQEIAQMREAGRIVARTLAEVANKVKPGVTTGELDSIAYKTINSLGGIPSFKGYRGYPSSICLSVNEEVVHGIPGKRVLAEGDIISLDVGAIFKGYQGDSAITVPVGDVSEIAENLIRVTREALGLGIAQARDGGRLGDVSWAIQSHAEASGFGVIREYVGHGIGRDMHEDPQIPNFGHSGRGLLLKKGMTFALEPMVAAGDWRTKVLKDNWTVVTMDGSLAAHFEHTIAITEEGPEILTRI